MFDAEAGDGAVHSVNIGELVAGTVRVEYGELGVHSRVEVLVAEQPPIGDEAFILLARQLGAPGAIVESLVLAEDERGERAAESQRVARIVLAADNATRHYY